MRLEYAGMILNARFSRKTAGMITIGIMDNFDPAAQAQAQAMADLQHAEAQAAALLAELEAKDAANAVAATVQPHRMPSPYAPGDEPDPVKGVASPGAQQLHDALDSSFRPVDLARVKETTLASSHTIDFAQKIRDAQKFKGSH